MGFRRSPGTAWIMEIVANLIRSNNHHLQSKSSAAPCISALSFIYMKYHDAMSLFFLQNYLPKKCRAEILDHSFLFDLHSTISWILGNQLHGPSDVCPSFRRKMAWTLPMVGWWIWHVSRFPCRGRNCETSQVSDRDLIGRTHHLTEVLTS